MSLPLVTLLSLLAAPPAANARITKKNWEHHPKVEAVRAVVAEVEAALAAKTLTVETLDDCESELSNFTVGRDAKHVVRSLVRSFGSEDSSQTHTLSYDDKGRLRFVFVKVGAVPSAWVEVRLWLSDTGAVLWRSRTSGGEGPTYYATEEADLLIKTPDTFLKQHTSCPKRPE